MGPLNYSWLAARCLGHSQRRNLSGWSAAGLGERRLDAAEKYARAAAATGQLAVSKDECRDVLSATLDGALWHRLGAERGWSDERFAAWRGQLWIPALVTV